jgi:hypothetical protein
MSFIVASSVISWALDIGLDASCFGGMAAKFGAEYTGREICGGENPAAGHISNPH